MVSVIKWNDFFYMFKVTMTHVNEGYYEAQLKATMYYLVVNNLCVSNGCKKGNDHKYDRNPTDFVRLICVNFTNYLLPSSDTSV